MDEIDIAQDNQATDIAHAVARVKRYSGVSATECRECGEEIPEARRNFLPGVDLCVACQTKLESASIR